MSTIMMVLTVGLAVFVLMCRRRLGAMAAQLRLLAHSMRKEFH